jgi:hypothetical protein
MVIFNMNKPEIIGCEVITPDGRGNILSLHNGGLTVHLNKKHHNQVMIGRKHGAELHYFYKYDEVDLIKGQYCFNDERISFQYDDITKQTKLDGTLG